MRHRDIVVGIVLVVSALLAVFAMGHHPSGHGHGQGGVNQIVHGGMTGLLIAWWFGLAWLTARRDFPGALPLAGLAAFSASTVVHLISATINGFVVPALASRGEQAPGHDVFLLCWETNQAFAKLGVFATGAAFALYGVWLLLRPCWFNRIAGIAGIASAAIGVAILLASGSRMDVPTAFAIYAVHAGWLALIGAGLITGRLTDSAHEK